MIRRLIIAIVLFLAMLSTAIAQVWQPGQAVIALAYCTTEKDTARLVAAASKDGDDGYRRIMNEPQSACFDAKLHSNVRPVAVEIVADLFVMTHADGTLFHFYSAKSQSGRLGYIWDTPERRELEAEGTAV